MNKSNSDAPWLALTLDRQLAQPLQAQLCGAIRRLVQEGRLASGDRLPPSRALAAELSISRLTVVTAYDQLVGEGYVIGRRGAGMFVAPDLAGLPRPPARRDGGPPPPTPAPFRPFDTGAADLAGFPHRLWARLLEQAWRDPEPGLLAPPDPLGWSPLRVAIAQHLGDWRGIACAPAQVIVTSGLGESVALVAAALLSPGQSVTVEEPGHGPLRRALAAAGLGVVPQRVDAEGLDPEALGSETRAVVVTPSRHFPLGMTLPLARRLGLLAWAVDTGGWVIEDDYDGEYRFRGQPLPAMMSLDEAGRVLYAGSFTKVMFPGLRLGFLVVPPALEASMREAMQQRGAQAGIIAQPALARFIAEGHFATHLRRMRRLYAGRQRVLLAALAESCAGLLEAEEAPSGMHLVARFAPELATRMDDVAASGRCIAAGVRARPLSGFFAGEPTAQGLVLGFAGFREAEIRRAAAAMGAALRA